MKSRSRSWAPGRSITLSDWRELQGGDLVSVMKNAQTIARGRVEEVSESGRVLWIVNDESETLAFLESDGILIRRS